MRIKSLTIIACLTIGIALLTVGATTIPKVTDYTKLPTGEKVLFEPNKLNPGTIEYVSWKYFNAVLKKDRKLASSLASKFNKNDIAFDPGWRHIQRRYMAPNFDLTKKLFIKIYAKNMKRGDKIKGKCRIYGYSKNGKNEKWVDFSIIFIDGTIKIGR